MSENNPFKQLEKAEAPKALKERVMTSVKLSQLLMEVTDLFTVQMGRTALSMFEKETKASDASTAKRENRTE